VVSKFLPERHERLRVTERTEKQKAASPPNMHDIDNNRIRTCGVNRVWSLQVYSQNRTL